MTIGGGDNLHVLGAAGAAFDLEHGYSGIDDLVYELNGAKVLWTHDVLVVNLELTTGFKIGYTVASAAKLIATASVCGCSVFLEAEVAFPGNGHAQGSVDEKLKTQQLPAWTAHVLFFDTTAYVLDLRESKFAGQDYHIRKLSVELGGLKV